MPRPPVEITPPPPYAAGTGLPWDVAVEDAVAEIARARAEHGDTFVVDSGRDRYLFTFSPTGVESFYALPEEAASKGLADYLMLRRKLPDEIFDGRRTMPHLLFRKGDVAHYLANLDRALEATVAELGEAGLPGRVRSDPAPGPPDGAGVVGQARAAATARRSSGWSSRSTSSTAPTPSCTPTRWPRWPRRTRPRSAPRSPR